MTLALEWRHLLGAKVNWIWIKIECLTTVGWAHDDEKGWKWLFVQEINTIECEQARE